MNQGFGASPPIVLLLNILRRRWWVVGACMTMAALMGLALGSLFSPVYTAKVQIVLDEQVAARAARIDDAAVQTWVELLSTASHIRRLHASLDEDPIQPDDASFARPLLTDLAERVAATLDPWLRGSTPDTSATTDAAQDLRLPTLKELERGLRSFKERQSRILSVTFTWTDPNVAAAIANRSAALFLEHNFQLQMASREQAREAVQRRMVLARADLGRAAATLAQFRVEHGVSDADRADQIDTQIAEANRQLAIASSGLQASRQLGALEGPVAFVARLPIGTQPAAVAVPAGNEDSAILESRVQYLVRRLAVLQEASAGARSAEARLRELRLEAGAAAESFESLLKQEAELRDGTILPEAKIVSLANAPSQPSSPDPIFFLPPALLVGAIGGGLLAIVLERIDRRLRTERTAEAALGARCIGVVPRVRRTGTLVPLRTLALEPFAPYTRAIRSVTMTVLGFPTDQRGGKVILFTSSVKQDGKTALAVSFASYAALLRRRVLVIDLDLPSPEVGRLLGGATGPGALEVLKGVPAETAIHRNGEFGIDYLPLSAGPVDPLLLMADEGMRALLEALRRRYDCIVIDGAPLLGNPEARVLVALADHVILTLRWGWTEVETARAAMREIRKVAHPASRSASVSSVLTEVDLRLYATYPSGMENGETGQPRLSDASDRGVAGA
ncbi:GumC family protein [Falsiroseomonas sp. HC035]|uniref:GumC family protein n=1 Tax=Falsiroseomonas sp. HC035 TaxID=3390999 RepID=UPI003D315CE7